MGEKKAIVYSAEWCPWCHKVIDFLKENKVEVEVKDVGENPDYAKEVQEKTGQSGIPIILIGDEIIIGFNQPKLKEVLGLGQEKKPEEKKDESEDKKVEKSEEETKEKKEEDKEKSEKKSEEKKEVDSSYV